jgi:RNA polymerase sigma factor (TIGR02999 family)
MEPTPPASVTQFLIGWCRGNRADLDRLLPTVYDELRHLAAAKLSAERAGHTLQPTALVHEAYLRLIEQHSVDWRDRAQFLGLAAEMMRRILVNHARDRNALKRGGGAEKVTINAALGLAAGDDLDVRDIDAALTRLAELDARKARVVELRFFAGLTTEEIAEVVGTSTATIERDWRFARAWLFDALSAA